MDNPATMDHPQEHSPMTHTRIEVSLDLQDWRVIAVDLALARMFTPEGERFVNQLISQISMARDQHDPAIVARRDRARLAYKARLGDDILIDDEAAVYADTDGRKWVQGWLGVPDTDKALRPDGIISLDTNLVAGLSGGPAAAERALKSARRTAGDLN
jgi:hypothetical protein